MVRTAVKTLTLNVYGIPLPAVQRFVTSRPAAAYFAELATFIAEQCQVGARSPASYLTSQRATGCKPRGQAKVAAKELATAAAWRRTGVHLPPPPPSILPPRPPPPTPQVLDRLLSSWDVASPQAQGSVEACLAEVEDLLSYCNDVLATGETRARPGRRKTRATNEAGGAPRCGDSPPLLCRGQLRRKLRLLVSQVHTCPAASFSDQGMAHVPDGQ